MPESGLGALPVRLGLEPHAAEFWWLSLPLWFVLGWTAWIDARTGRVPDKILLPGTFYTLAALGFSLFLLTAASALAITDALALFGLRLLGCLALGLALWGGNELWHRWRRQDSIGMGDVKWSLLAALGFGLPSVLWAWALAAWLGLAALGIQRLRGRKITQLYFAPYLFGGLLLAKLLLTARLLPAFSPHP